jgi:hypothetical protein
VLLGACRREMRRLIKEQLDRTLARQRLFSRRRQISRSSPHPPPEFVDQIRQPSDGTVVAPTGDKPVGGAIQ